MGVGGWSLPCMESFTGGFGTCCALCLEFSSPESAPSSFSPHRPHPSECSSGHTSSGMSLLTNTHPEIHQLMDGLCTRLPPYDFISICVDLKKRVSLLVDCKLYEGSNQGWFCPFLHPQYLQSTSYSVAHNRSSININS